MIQPAFFSFHTQFLKCSISHFQHILFQTINISSDQQPYVACGHHIGLQGSASSWFKFYCLSEWGQRKEAIKGSGPQHIQTVFRQHHSKGKVLRCIPTLNQQRKKKPDFIIYHYIHRQFIYQNNPRSTIVYKNKK